MRRKFNYYIVACHANMTTYVLRENIMFVSGLVGNPEDRFFNDATHIFFWYSLDASLLTLLKGYLCSSINILPKEGRVSA